MPSIIIGIVPSIIIIVGIVPSILLFFDMRRRIIYIIYMTLFSGIRRLKLYGVVLACLVCFSGFSGCARRVSYNVSTLYTDAFLSRRDLGSAEVVVLPLQGPRGTVAGGSLAADAMIKRLKPLRSDLIFVSYEDFERGFPPRFDRRQIADFYARLFGDEILAIKAMDSLWEAVRYPYLLAFTLRDGATIRNLDGSVFMHVSIMAELWRRGDREVVWRAQCRGVSDDKGMTDSELIAESMRYLAAAIPATAPNYGQENW